MSWTWTVTAGLMALPAWVVVGCWTKPSLLAPAGLTVMPDSVPVIVLVTVSVAVIDWEPAVLSVAEKVPVPLVSVVLAGSVAWASLLVKWTVPV